MKKVILFFAASNGALAVILGAFGAHGLKGRLSDSLLAAYQTSTDYHLLHVLALMALALVMLQLSQASRWLSITAYCWMVGIALFCGSLYGLAFGGPAWLGPVTPIGGLLLIIGWLSLAIGVSKAAFLKSVEK